MIDLHSHYLPGIDDGAPGWEMTMAMLRQAEEAGIRRLLATPHINEHTTAQIEEQIQELFQRVEEQRRKAGINVELQLAGEVHFDSRIRQWITHDWLLVGVQRKYLIIDLPIQGFPIKIDDIFFNFGLKGITPIIAHPERNVIIQQNPERLKKWLEQGCVLQINAGSITGNFGSFVKSIAKNLLDQNMVHFISSDAHDIRNRSYRLLVQAQKFIREQYGSVYSEILFEKNPSYILAGENVILPGKAIRTFDQNTVKKYWHKFKLKLNGSIIY